MKKNNLKQDRDKERAFWDKVSKDERIWILNTTKKDIIKDILKRNYWWEKIVGKVSSKKILDVGCGNAYYATYWNLTGNTAKGCDFSRQTIKNNNLIQGKLGLKQNFYVTSSEKLRESNNYFDIVHVHWVIHHVPEELRDKTIIEFSRVLKSNGKLFVYETNYSYPARCITQSKSFRYINIFRYFAIKTGWLDSEEYALTNKGYIDLLKRNGFEIEKVHYDKDFIFSYLLTYITKNKHIINLAKPIDFIIAKLTPNRYCNNIAIIARKVKK